MLCEQVRAMTTRHNKELERADRALLRLEQESDEALEELCRLARSVCPEEPEAAQVPALLPADWLLHYMSASDCELYVVRGCDDPVATQRLRLLGRTLLRDVPQPFAQALHNKIRQCTTLPPSPRREA